MSWRAEHKINVTNLISQFCSFVFDLWDILQLKLFLDVYFMVCFFAQGAIITSFAFILVILIKLYMYNLRFYQLHVILHFICDNIKMYPNFGSFICIFISFQHILCVPKIAQPFFIQPQEMTFNKDTKHPFNSHSATVDLHNQHHFST